MSTDRSCADTRSPRVKGEFVLPKEDRIFNPSRETAPPDRQGRPRSGRTARSSRARSSPAWAAPDRRPSTASPISPRHHKRDDIERACEQVLTLSQPSYQALKRILERTPRAPKRALPPTAHAAAAGSHIRAIEEYQAFWDEYCRAAAPNDPSLTTTR